MGSDSHGNIQIVIGKGLHVSLMVVERFCDGFFFVCFFSGEKTEMVYFLINCNYSYIQFRYSLTVLFKVRLIFLQALKAASGCSSRISDVQSLAQRR